MKICKPSAAESLHRLSIVLQRPPGKTFASASKYFNTVNFFIGISLPALESYPDGVFIVAGPLMILTAVFLETSNARIRRHFEATQQQLLAGVTGTDSGSNPSSPVDGTFINARRRRMSPSSSVGSLASSRSIGWKSSPFHPHVAAAHREFILSNSRAGPVNPPTPVPAAKPRLGPTGSKPPGLANVVRIMMQQDEAAVSQAAVTRVRFEKQQMVTGLEHDIQHLNTQTKVQKAKLAGRLQVRFAAYSAPLFRLRLFTIPRCDGTRPN